MPVYGSGWWGRLLYKYWIGVVVFYRMFDFYCLSTTVMFDDVFVFLLLQCLMMWFVFLLLL